MQKCSLCRVCVALCPVKVEIDAAGVPVSAKGDKDNSHSEGFFCAKGKYYPAMHRSDTRFLHSQKRMPDGELAAISSQAAIEEVAEKIQAIIDQHGPRAVAIYSGTLHYQASSTAAMASAWCNALGLKMLFSSGTIDQPGKQVAAAAHGHWLGGYFPFDECDAWLMLGSNPLVAISGGIPHANPGRRLKRAQKHGLKLVVVDPRRTETARQAALHIQPRPGTDPAILAGIIREIVDRDLCDREFLERHVDGFERLCAYVKPYTPERVAAIADIPPQQVTEAAQLFAAADKAVCTAATGANMSGWSNINEYLVLCLNTVCGVYRQEGDKVSNHGVLTTRREFKAQAIPPYPIAGYGKPLRIRDYSPAVCGLPTSALADEILLQGEGQVKALITIGGNPMTAWPDQEKTFAALSSLDLLVAVEPRQTPTTQLADYVLAPKLAFEKPETTLSTENLLSVGPAFGYTEPYGQYVPAIVDPPKGSDLLEDWEFFYGMAQQMVLQLTVRAGIFPIVGVQTPETEVDMVNKPDSEQVLDMVTKGSWVPLQALRDDPEKILFPEDVTVKTADAGWQARLDVGHQELLEDLESFGRGDKYAREGFDYRLISRRIPNSFNSCGTDTDGLRDRYMGNPAFMHPQDMLDKGLERGDVIIVQSPHNEVEAVAWPDKDLRRGLVSLSHGWGENPGGQGDVRRVGANSGRLMSVEVDCDRFSGIPLMSALPVKILPR